MENKEEACVRRSNIKEERKAERFKQLIELIEKKIKLEERRTMIEERKAALEEKNATLEKKRVKITANAEDAKMLTLNINSLDADARRIVQSTRYHMLERKKMSWRRWKMRMQRRWRWTRSRRLPMRRRRHLLAGKHLAGMVGPAR